MLYCVEVSRIVLRKVLVDSFLVLRSPPCHPPLFLLPFDLLAFLASLISPLTFSIPSTLYVRHALANLSTRASSVIIWKSWGR